MDELDLAIVRTLGVRPFGTWPRQAEGLRPPDVARALDENVGRVKDRTRRLEDDGILRGYEVYPNLRHLGLNLTTYHLRVPADAKRGRLDGVTRMDGVIGVFDFLGEDLCIDLSYQSKAQADRRLAAIAQMLGSEVRPVAFFQRSFPEVDRDLTPLDWRIIQALRGDAKRPLNDVADDVGVTAKTARRRADRMLEEGSLDRYAVLDPSRIHGAVPFSFVCWFRDGLEREGVRALVDQFRDRYFAAFRPPSDEFGMYDMDLFARSTSDIERMRQRALALDEVERVQVMLPTWETYDGAWIDEAIDQRVEQTRNA